MKTYNNLNLLYARRAIRRTHPLDFSTNQFINYFNNLDPDPDPDRLTTTPFTGRSGGQHFPITLLKHLVKIGFLTTYKHGHTRLYRPTSTGVVWMFEEDEKKANELLRLAVKVAKDEKVKGN